MTELVALLSTGKGTWSEVIKLLNAETWDKVILITNEFGQNTFQKKEGIELVVINPNESVELLIDKIVAGLKPKINGSEIALNLTSGTGKEHMAVMSALLKLGLGIRFVVFTQNGLKEI